MVVTNKIKSYSKNKLFPLTFAALFFIASLFINACDNHRVYEHNYVIEKGLWDYRDIKKFNFTIDDTISFHNMYINIRHRGDYKYSNCFLFITIYYPNNTRSKDTVDCILANNDGEWLGKGIGDIFANQILYYKKFRFRNKGNYTIEIEHAMRDEILEGITDVGLRIEKFNQ